MGEIRKGGANFIKGWGGRQDEDGMDRRKTLNLVSKSGGWDGNGW